MESQPISNIKSGDIKETIDFYEKCISNPLIYKRFFVCIFVLVASMSLVWTLSSQQKVQMYGSVDIKNRTSDTYEDVHSHPGVFILASSKLLYNLEVQYK